MSEHKLIGHETYLEKFVTLYENNEPPNKILLSGKIYFFPCLIKLAIPSDAAINDFGEKKPERRSYLVAYFNTGM